MSRLLGRLDEHARAGLTAFRTEAADLSYAELADRVRRCARATTGAGIRAGDVVGVVLPKSVDSIAIFLGLLVAGACPGYLDPRLDATALADMAEAVTMGHIVTGTSDDVDRLQHATSATVLARRVFDRGEASSTPRRPARSSDPAMMLFTSGSTGAPKGVVLTQRNVLTNAEGVVEHTALTSRDRLLHLMPLHHTNGLNNQVIAPLLAGATIVLHDRFRPEAAVEAMRREAPTYVTGVPTMYLRMIPHVREKERFPALRFLRCGSAPLTPEQQDRIEDAFRSPVVLSYGMSEATCTTTMNPVDAPRRGTVGTVLRDQCVRIVRPGTLTAVPAGKDGEIVIGGRAVMQGYVGTEADNPVEDGWLHTGDLGRLDAGGYLTITGRLKDTIIRGGENISPATIEEALTAHPAVENCCVVAGPHPDLGEVPVAFVLAVVDQPAPSAAELAKWVEERLSRTYVPAELHLIDRLPLNGVGKIDRSALSRQARSKTA